MGSCKANSMEKTTHSPGTCPVRGRVNIATTAAIISAKWTPQLIYALANGVQRFCHLQTSVGGVNPRTLSARLDDLERAGIVTKTTYAETPPRVEYSLTAKGMDLVPILGSMQAWGEKYCPSQELVTSGPEQDRV